MNSSQRYQSWEFNLPVGATAGSSTKLVAGMGRSSWPPVMSSQTNLSQQIIHWAQCKFTIQKIKSLILWYFVLHIPTYFWNRLRHAPTKKVNLQQEWNILKERVIKGSSTHQTRLVKINMGSKVIYKQERVQSNKIYCIQS